MVDQHDFIDIATFVPMLATVTVMLYTTPTSFIIITTIATCMPTMVIIPLCSLIASAWYIIF